MTMSGKIQPIVISIALLVCSMPEDTVLAADSDGAWAHQSMAWVLGPDSASIRSPYEEAQPTGFHWSIVPGNVAAVHYPGGSVISGRVTQNITDLNAAGLNSFEDYKIVLAGVVDAWTDISGIQNLGYIEETGEVMVGGIDEIVNRGPSAEVGHIRFMAYDSPVIPTNILASATYIPDPEANTNLATNRARAGDIRFRSDANIWGQGSSDGFYFRRIAMHEMGHVLGFGHNSFSDSVMGGGRYSQWDLGEGDIAGAVAIYGLNIISGLLPGDANNDNQVTGSDLVVVQQNFGNVDPNDPINGLFLGDANDDGQVTGADLIVVQQNFGNTLGQVNAAVPEPASIGLLALVSVGVLARRRRIATWLT